MSLLLIGGGVAVAVGLIMVICTGGDSGPGHSGIGFGLLTFGIPMVVVIGAALVYTPRDRGRVRRLIVGSVALVVIYASMAAAFASIAGQLVRWIDPADYTGRYGTKVTVALPEKCENDSHVYVGSGATAADSDVVCTGSSWQMDGASRTGTVIIGWNDIDLPQGISVPDKVEAYVLGDKGYSVNRVGKVENVAFWGRVPLWWLPIGLLGTLVGILALAKSGWVAAKRDAAVSEPE